MDAGPVFDVGICRESLMTEPKQFLYKAILILNMACVCCVGRAHGREAWNLAALARLCAICGFFLLCGGNAGSGAASCSYIAGCRICSPACPYFLSLIVCLCTFVCA